VCAIRIVCLGEILVHYKNEEGGTKSADDGGSALFVHLSFPDPGSHLSFGKSKINARFCRKYKWNGLPCIACRNF